MSRGSPSTSILEQIIESTRAEVEQRKRAAPTVGAPTVGAAASPGRLRDALAQPGMGVIAEIKRRSPSAGELRVDVDVDALALAYEQGGASAISVLTEGPHFGGSLEDLRAAVAGPARCRSCARTSSSMSYSCTRPSRPVRRRCC